MRLQLPRRGEIGGGGVRSIVPVATVTPPAANDCRALNVIPSLTRWIVRIQVPSMGAANPDPSSPALTAELMPPMLRAIRAEAIIRLLATRFLFFRFLRIDIIVFSFRKLKYRIPCVRDQRS